MRRYIDADKLRSEFDYNSGTYCAAWEFIDKPSDIQFLIDEQPTADVRENVRGEWIDRGKDMMLRWQCSECGRRDTHIYNFCPDCGADMRGDKQ